MLNCNWFDRITLPAFLSLFGFGRFNKVIQCERSWRLSLSVMSTFVLIGSRCGSRRTTTAQNRIQTSSRFVCFVVAFGTGSSWNSIAQLQALLILLPKLNMGHSLGQVLQPRIGRGLDFLDQQLITDLNNTFVFFICGFLWSSIKQGLLAFVVLLFGSTVTLVWWRAGLLFRRG